jgi:hypothetical protein
MAERFQFAVDHSSTAGAGPDYYWQFLDVNASGSSPTMDHHSQCEHGGLLRYSNLLFQNANHACNLKEAIAIADRRPVSHDGPGLANSVADQSTPAK